MKPPAATRRRPLAIRVWRSPLARGVDRAEAWWTWILLTAFLLALPILATIASVEWGELSNKAAAEAGAVTDVQATLISDARYDLTGYRSLPTDVTADATWTGRNGLVATGQIDVMPGARSGDHQTIWLDRSGALVPAPMTSTDAAVEAMLVGLTGWLGVGLVLFGIWWIVRRRLDRRRWRAWAQEWEWAGPQPQ